MNTTPVAARKHIGWAIMTLFGLFALGLVTSGVDAQEIERIDQALVSGWTNETTDGLPPVQCQGRVGGVSCSGKYCDNVALFCRDAVGATGDSNWDDYFSEEGNNIALPDWQIPAGGISGPFNGSFCPGTSWVSGISCSGRYCDNISLDCTDMPDVHVTSCRWTTRSFSEEEGAVVFPENEILGGVACFGKYCDNKKYYLCQFE